MSVLSRCIASLQSMTHAQMARRLLNGERISCEIVNLDKRLTTHGCAYGVEFDCREKGRIRDILAQRGLGYGDIIGR